MLYGSTGLGWSQAGADTPSLSTGQIATLLAYEP